MNDATTLLKRLWPLVASSVPAVLVRIALGRDDLSRASRAWRLPGPKATPAMEGKEILNVDAVNGNRDYPQTGTVACPRSVSRRAMQAKWMMVASPGRQTLMPTK